MKKFFLIPLLTLVCSIMAWAATVQVGDYQALEDAFDNAQNGDVIEMTQDIVIPGTFFSTGHLMDITKSITFDGKGHTLYGYGKRGSNYTTIAINTFGSSMVDVVIQNCTIVNPLTRVIETRGNLHSLTIDNCVLEAQAPANYGYQQTITIGGNQASIAEVNIINSTIIAKKYYPIIMFNPVEMTLTNSKLQGWCSLYFKGQDSSAGSNGSKVNATNCTFDAQNKYTGATNTFGAFVLEDGGIDIELDNCVVDATYTDPKGVATQSMFLLSKWKELKNNVSVDPCSMTITGANSRIIGKFIDYGWSYAVPVTFELQGGSYYANDFEEGVASSWVYINPDKYVAVKMENDGEPIYRISLIPAANINTDDPENPIVTFYGINDNVEDLGAGTNPTTAFAVMEGETVEMVNNNTVADYVLVASPTTEDQTILKVGKKDGEEKVNQTLVVNSGLDVQSDAQVIVQPGSTLQIGAGGIVTENTESIIVEADEEGAASLLLDPTITVNNTPDLTVRMTAKQIGRNADGDFLWHRFAMPVAATITSWDKEGSLAGTTTYPTYIYAWDYSANDWANLSGVEEMVPLQGYTLTLASNWINYDGETATDAETETGNLNVPQDVVYTFKGNLVGNTDQALNFQHEGFNFFGNSYTGYMSVLNLISGIESDKVEDVIYMWNADQQKYVGVSLYKLQSGKGLKNWQKEVAPMQTFIMRLRGADSANESVNYSSSIWGNPRYGNSGSNPAPRRRMPATIEEDTYMEITVTAANGQSDVIDFAESASNTDAFENGYDVVKFMNEHTLNLYTTLAGEEFSSVVTDNLEGKTLNLKTNSEISYTISFENVEGEEYALRDNATGAIIAIENGVTYEFAAQPNSTVEGRFEIISVAKMPTAIENTEVKANAKGIYTIMGQYLGEDFEALPAGVYVINGVKIVK